MNIYQQQNPNYFCELENLVNAKPRGFTQMLEAKGRRRELNSIPKYKHLFDWLNGVLPEIAQHLATKEKCYWILNGLKEFPKCANCGKQLSSKHFLNVFRGYRPFCSHTCRCSSPLFAQHVSEGHQRAFEEDSNYYISKAIRSKNTRQERYGTYMPDSAKKKAKETVAKHIEEDPSFLKKAQQKRAATNIKNGHHPNWHNEEQMVQTRLAKHGGKWEDEKTLAIRKQHAFEKYGVDDANKLSVVKLHKKQAFQKKYGEDVTTVFQTPKFKSYMKSINEQRKQKEHDTKKTNGTFKKSDQEDAAYDLLCKKYGENNVIRQYWSEAYPFNCDFYIKSLHLYIECNFSWTHGGHFFNENDEEDLKKLQQWKDKGTKYYLNAIDTWTVRDVKKRQAAKKNKLNYVVFWNLDDAYCKVGD